MIEKNSIENKAFDRLEAVIKQITGIVDADFQLAKAREIFTYKRINKNDYFKKAGDEPQYAGFVVSGSFRYFHLDDGGHEHTKNFAIENGLLLTYGAYLRKQPSPMYIQALEDSEIMAFDYSRFYEFAETDANWLKLLLRISEIAYLEKENRESELLIYDAQTRYLNFCRDFPDLEKRLKQYHIASYLGIAPEVLSRIRTQLNN